MTEARNSSGLPFGTMYDVVRYWAETTPDAPALVADGRAPLAYRDLLAAMDAVGAVLNAAGFGRNDRIAIIHPGGRDLAVAVMGVWSHATAVPMNPGYTPGELAGHFRDMRVDAVAIAERMETPARRVAGMLDLPVLDLAPDGAGTVSVTAGNRRVATASDTMGPAQPDDVVTVIATSGTTSGSKLVPIRHRQIVCRNVYAARDLQLGPRDRCLNMLRLYHSGGLNQGLCCSLIAGGSVGMLTDFSVGGFFRAMESMQPAWCTGAYTMYHAIHRDLADHRDAVERIRPRLRFLRSGTGWLNPTIGEDLQRAFDSPLVVTYGTSETGSITAEPLPPGPRKHGSVGRAVHDGVVILDEAGSTVGANTPGEIAVRGPTVFDGYENDEAANRAAFIDGWFRTGDLGYFDADGYLFITGRIKELINRGGQKISPNEIDDALMAHPEIATASTFPVPHPTLGEEVAAAVVLSTGSSLDESALSTFLRGRLAAYKLPRRFVVADEIPKGPTGKVQRHTLAAAFGLSEGIAATAAADEKRPATALEKKLQALWASALGRAHVGLHDDFFMLGGDSLQAVELFLKIEKALGRQLPRSVLFEAGTVAEMAKRIGAASPMGCLVPIRATGNRPILFCVHDINGEAFNFRALADYLGEDQPVYGIRLAGLDGSETPLARIEDMAARYIAEIRQLQPAGPVYLVGYSMGGWIAYEMACQLRAAGETVGLLGLLDTQSRRGRRRATVGHWLAHHRERLSNMKPSETVPYLATRFQNLAKIVSTAIRQRAFGAAWRFYEIRRKPIPSFVRRPLAASRLAIRSYAPGPYDGDAVLFRASPYAWDHADGREGWRQVIGGELEVRPITGQHHEIFDDPHVRRLARELEDCLHARQQGHAPAEDALAAAG